MIYGIIFGYVLPVIYSTSFRTLPALKWCGEYKKEGYTSENWFKTFLEASQVIREGNYDDDMQYCYYWSNFIPGYNIWSSLYNTMMGLLRVDYQKVKRPSAKDMPGLYLRGKSRKEIDKEIKMLVADKKREDLKLSLGEGKAGIYDNFDDFKKIEILDDLQNGKIENDCYNNMSNQEKLDFLYSEREKILSGHTIDTSKVKKIGRR